MNYHEQQLIDNLLERFLSVNPRDRRDWLSDMKVNPRIQDDILRRGTEISRAINLPHHEAVEVAMYESYFNWIDIVKRTNISRWDQAITPRDADKIQLILDTVDQQHVRGYVNDTHNRQPDNRQMGTHSAQWRQLPDSTQYNTGSRGRSSADSTPPYQPPQAPRRDTRPEAEKDLVHVTSRRVTFGIMPIVSANNIDNKGDLMNKQQHEHFYQDVQAAKNKIVVPPPKNSIERKSDEETDRDIAAQLQFDMNNPKLNRLVDKIYQPNAEEGEIESFAHVEQWFSTRNNDVLSTLNGDTNKYLYCDTVTLRKEVHVLKPEHIELTVNNLRKARIDTIDTLLGGLENNGVIHPLEGLLLRKEIIRNYNTNMLTRLGMSPRTFTTDLGIFTTKNNIEVLPHLQKIFERDSTCHPDIIKNLDFDLEIQRSVDDVLGDIMVATVSNDGDGVDDKIVVCDRSIGIGYISIPVGEFMFGESIKEQGYCMATSDTLKELKETIMEYIDKHDAFVLMTSDGYLLHITSTATRNKEFNRNNNTTPYRGLIFVNDISITGDQNRIAELYGQIPK